MLFICYRHLLRYNHETKEWLSLYNSKELRNYTMMSASKCGKVVCCGSINGQVFVISVNQQFQVNRKGDNSAKLLYIINILL